MTLFTFLIRLKGWVLDKRFSVAMTSASAITAMVLELVDIFPEGNAKVAILAAVMVVNGFIVQARVWSNNAVDELKAL